MAVRLRQICVVAPDLDWATSTLGAALGTEVVHRDPHIVNAFGGMFNALLLLGHDCFVEVIHPDRTGG